MATDADPELSPHRRSAFSPGTHLPRGSFGCQTRAGLQMQDANTNRCLESNKASMPRVILYIVEDKFAAAPSVEQKLSVAHTCKHLLQL